MLQTIAIRGYRSLREVILPLGRLSVVTGANGAGKSSLYRAMRLLADCGRGEVIASLAREGGLESVLWAGPEQLSGARRTGKVEGTTRNRPVSFELGFAADDFGYSPGLCCARAPRWCVGPALSPRPAQNRAAASTSCRAPCRRIASCWPNTPKSCPLGNIAHKASFAYRGFHDGTARA